jgi:hypothetical protein
MTTTPISEMLRSFELEALDTLQTLRYRGRHYATPTAASIDCQPGSGSYCYSRTSRLTAGHTRP